MTDASAADAARARLLTLRIGGALLIVSAALRLVQTAMVPAIGGIPAVPLLDLVVTSAALAVFAIGIGAAGSVVARRVLGVVALLILAAWPLVERIVGIFVPITMEAVSALQVWGWTSLAVQLSAALVATLEIARAGVITGALRWAPLWGLVAIAAPQLIGALAMAAPGADPQAIAGPLVGLSQLTTVGVPLTLGILAVVNAGARPPGAPVQVYPPAP